MRPKIPQGWCYHLKWRGWPGTKLSGSEFVSFTGLAHCQEVGSRIKTLKTSLIAAASNERNSVLTSRRNEQRRAVFHGKYNWVPIPVLVWRREEALAGLEHVRSEVGYGWEGVRAWWMRACVRVCVRASAGLSACMRLRAGVAARVPRVSLSPSAFLSSRSRLLAPLNFCARAQCGLFPSCWRHPGDWLGL